MPGVRPDTERDRVDTPYDELGHRSIREFPIPRDQFNSNCLESRKGPIRCAVTSTRPLEAPILLDNPDG
jgi:hypothetical protein